MLLIFSYERAYRARTIDNYKGSSALIRITPLTTPADCMVSSMTT
jgi:hypothetical protein